MAEQVYHFHHLQQQVERQQQTIQDIEDRLRECESRNPPPPKPPAENPKEISLANTHVRNHSGFLAEAISNTWTPNEEYKQKVERDALMTGIH